MAAAVIRGAAEAEEVHVRWRSGCMDQSLGKDSQNFWKTLRNDDESLISNSRLFIVRHVGHVRSASYWVDILIRMHL